MRHTVLAVPLAAVIPLLASGCLATKGDIALLQDEMRVTRSQVGFVDTSVVRSSQQLRQQIATVSAELTRLSDSIRAQSARLASAQANTNGELSTMNGQIVQMQALLGQTTRNLQTTREQLNAIRENAPPTPSPAGATAMPGAQTGLPGSATLYLAGKQSLDNAAYSTARRSFDQLVSAYPNSVEAPAAQFYIGQSYTLEGNTGAADSVYVVLFTNFPKSPYAATGLYRHGTYLWDQGKKAEARIALNRVLTEYPHADEVVMVKNFLRDRDK